MTPSFVRLAAGSTLGLGVAALAALALPAPTFTTRSIVGVDAPEQAMRLAMAQGARDAIRSQPVLARAAATLLAANVKAPEPSLEERAAVLGDFKTAHATGQEARLANALPNKVRTSIGEGSATVDVIASDEQANVAAQIANAVAEAFLADEEDHAFDVRRRRDAAAAARMDGLIKAASTAHARLAALGGATVEPGQLPINAATQIAQAQGRADTIRAIIASGTPPLSDRKDVPDSVATLQRTYLDLTAQLSKARETFGDRHTTIISLRDGVARASASLTAEWKRLERVAQSEADAARIRDGALHRADGPVDASHRAATEDARAAVARADEAVARAASSRSDAPDEHVYRIYARAPVPSAANGFSGPVRGAIAALAGLAAFLLTLTLPARRRRIAAGPVGLLERQPQAAATPAAVVIPVNDRVETASVPEVELERREPTVRSEEVARPRSEAPRASDTALKEALHAILVRLDTNAIQGDVPTIMVAANDGDIATGPIALSLARAAAASGRRVLIIESDRPQPTLAGFADPDGEPTLIDVLGTLRVGLAPALDGERLTLAPAFRKSQQIASALARGGEAPFIEEIAAAFDLLVIDGGKAGGDAAPADVYLRIARYTSRRDDERFLAAMGAVPGSLAGTMVGRVFVAPTAATAVPPLGLDPEETPRSARQAPGRQRPTAVERIPMPRRKIGLR